MYSYYKSLWKGEIEEGTELKRTDGKTVEFYDKNGIYSEKKKWINCTSYLSYKTLKKYNNAFVRIEDEKELMLELI